MYYSQCNKQAEYNLLRNYLMQKTAGMCEKRQKDLTDTRQKQSMDPAAMALVFGPGLITAGLIPWMLYKRSKKQGRIELDSLQAKLNKKRKLTDQEQKNYKVLKQFEEGGEI